MTMQQLKKQAAALTAAQQAELAAFLVHLHNERDPSYQSTVNRRLDDRKREHWLTADEFEKRLGKN